MTLSEALVKNGLVSQKKATQLTKEKTRQETIKRLQERAVYDKEAAWKLIKMGGA